MQTFAQGYPPGTKVFVITNDKDQTLSSLSALDPDLFKYPYELTVIEPSEPLSDPHKLTWYHRKVFSTQFEGASHKQIFLYIEDDIHVPYSHLVHWWSGADDLYESSKLISSFYRVDGDPTAPSLGFLTDQFKNCEGEIWDVAGTEFSVGGGHFVQLWNPYSASYALSSTMMRDFVMMSEWDLNHLLSINPMGMDVRELAASGMMFSNLQGPPFDRSTAVVPWDKASGALKIEGAVYHMDVSKEAPNWCWVVSEARKKQQQEQQQQEL
ncbi:hypothetical protein TL16_g08403 [Triparma laevis f. inornata]|uniref:Uncharacterized protein n=1 Tax=Triparma laevis f. inornata TaxID=1714386 RepID=A0A9W7B5Q6_9STRA|nr:hypothetical protein TL16_g08403 [Triparma laevis f. inornata]